MLSISDSDYRSACVELLRGAVLRPSMYYSALSQFEAMLRGHSTAFQQMGVITRDEGFSSVFAEWLYEVKGASGASAGWAVLIDEMASVANEDPDVVFRDLVQEFLEEWVAAGDS